MLYAPERSPIWASFWISRFCGVRTPQQLDVGRSFGRTGAAWKLVGDSVSNLVLGLGFHKKMLRFAGIYWGSMIATYSPTYSNPCDISWCINHISTIRLDLVLQPFWPPGGKVRGKRLKADQSYGNAWYRRDRTAAEIHGFLISLDWFVGENLHRKPMGFYHQFGWAFLLKFSHHPILWWWVILKCFPWDWRLVWTPW